MNRKAIMLLSGGLDSILAARLVLDQGIELFAINFMTIFCTCTHKGCQHAATQAAKTLGIPLKIANITEEYLEIIRNPKHGYGSNMNPCIDCRIFTFSKARDYMVETGASFMVTGEVLGERPMSQRRDAMMLIERETGLRGKILRPLSAQFFNPTAPEAEGIVDRTKLLSISGRSRKPQIELASKFGIRDYPCPAGGCLLTDPGFARRIKDLMEHGSLDLANVRLLKPGRHFRLSSSLKLVIGRDDTDNRMVEQQLMPGDIVMRLKDYPGPFVLLRGKMTEGLIEEAARVAAYHTKFRDRSTLRVDYQAFPSNTSSTISVIPAPAAEVEKLRIN